MQRSNLAVLQANDPVVRPVRLRTVKSVFFLNDTQMPTNHVLVEYCTLCHSRNKDLLYVQMTLQPDTAFRMYREIKVSKSDC